MIRILQVGLTANRGGTETFVMNTYKAIDRTKIQFDFLVEHTKKLPFEEEIKALGGNVYHQYFYMREKKDKNYSSIAAFFEMHPEIDGVHLHCNGLSTTFRVLEEAYKRRLPVRILHSHSSDYMHPYSLREKIYEFYARRRIAKVTTQRLACSNAAGDWLFGKKQTYQVIPNAIDVEKFKFNPKMRACIRKELGIQPQEILLGFAGSFHYAKDPLYVVRVFYECYKKNSNFRLLMLGKGSLYQSTQNLIEQFGLMSKVICLGNVTGVWAYMQAMDLFLLPSVFEGFGIALLEAQAAGLPCITTKDTVPQEANVTGHVSYLQKKDNEKGWACLVEKKAKEKRYDGQKILKNSMYDLCQLGGCMESIYLR